jgi:hypothetical protein
MKLLMFVLRYIIKFLFKKIQHIMLSEKGDKNGKWGTGIYSRHS